MGRLTYLLGAIAVAALAAGLLDPPQAHAHALFGDEDPDRPLGSYLGLGFGHMVGGWDHLLFIAGVVLLAGGWLTAAKLISLFVLGHSLTLLVATLAGWQLNATVVDVVIALSLVYVGVQGIRGRPAGLRAVGGIVFAFGLVHGLGLSTRLQDLGLPDDGLVERILLFNVGVELGQLTALTVIVGLGVLFVRYAKPRSDTRRVAFGTIAAVGLVAAIVLPLAAADSGDPLETAGGPCAAEQAAPPPVTPQGGHPSKAFFGPEEEAPDEDLGHVVGDGYVIVFYGQGVSGSELDELEEWVLAEQPSFVIGAPAPDPDQASPIEVVTAQQGLSCSELSIEDLTEFRDAWFETVRTQQAP